MKFFILTLILWAVCFIFSILITWDLKPPAGAVKWSTLKPKPKKPSRMFTPKPKDASQDVLDVLRSR